MAEVMAMPKNGKVTIYFQTGLNDKGAPIVKSRTYSNVDSSATDDDLYETAHALGDLMVDEVTDICRIDINTLINI